MTDIKKCCELLKQLNKISQEKMRFNVDHMTLAEAEKLLGRQVDLECLRAARRLNVIFGMWLGIRKSLEFWSIDLEQQEKFFEVIEIFGGFKELETYITTVLNWYQGTSVQKNPSGQKVLIQGARILYKSGPLKTIPKALYRGLHRLDKRPKKGQNVFYHSEEPRLLSGWSAQLGTARNFSGESGFLLSVKKEDVLNCAEFILWPGCKGGQFFKSEQEYVLFIKKPMPVTVIWDSND